MGNFNIYTLYFINFIQYIEKKYVNLSQLVRWVDNDFIFIYCCLCCPIYLFFVFHFVWFMRPFNEVQKKNRIKEVAVRRRNWKKRVSWIPDGESLPLFPETLQLHICMLIGQSKRSVMIFNLVCNSKISELGKFVVFGG